MKQARFSWLIWSVFIVVTAALAVAGWYYAQCSIREWANILINLIITIIGAFLGFITALWLDKLNENKKNIETKKNYIQSLLRDINKIKDNLNLVIEKDTKGEIKHSADGTIIFQSLQGKYLYFELPIWEAMVSAGEVNLFNDEFFFDDLCKLSAMIKTLNNIENNVMIAKLVNAKINIDEIREQKLKEIYDICNNIDTILTNKINNKT